jgi:hypothetical protein
VEVGSNDVVVEGFMRELIVMDHRFAGKMTV